MVLMIGDEETLIEIHISSAELARVRQNLLPKTYKRIAKKKNQ